MVEVADKHLKRRRGGSMNPIVFHDYEGFLAKFKDNPKTTDECWTPKDVYEAVLKFVGEIYPLEGKQILRPFYPGGDYGRRGGGQSAVLNLYQDMSFLYRARHSLLSIRAGANHLLMLPAWCHCGCRRPADMFHKWLASALQLCEQSVWRHFGNNSTPSR